MSEALELLSSGGDISTYTAEPETEGHIVVGKDRFITVPEGLKRIAVQHDHDIETVTFDCPRYWDDHDMSEMNVYVNYQRPDGVMGSYRCSEVWPDETDPDIMHFNWTVGGHTTAVDGNLKMQVCVKMIIDVDDPYEVNHWNSEINEDLYISKGLDCGAPQTNTPLVEEEYDIEENGAYEITPSSGLGFSKVKVNVNVASGVVSDQPDPNKPVRFYSDGELVHSCTIEEAQQLTEMPEHPDLVGERVFTGWNISLATLNTCDAPMDIEAMLAPRIPLETWLTVNLGDDDLDVNMYLLPYSPNGLTVNWGDGSEPETVASVGPTSINHVYSNAGHYKITITIASSEVTYLLGNGSQTLFADNPNILRGVDLGWGVTYLQEGAFSGYPELLWFNGGMTFTRILKQTFAACYKLKRVVLGMAVTEIRSGAFQNCHSLERIGLYAEDTLNIEESAFHSCYSLERVYIPEGVTFTPSGSTSIKGGQFDACHSLESIRVPVSEGAVVNSFASNCHRLKQVYIPEGVKVIEENAFNGCDSVQHIEFPSTISEFKTYAFYCCSSLRAVDLSKVTAVPKFDYRAFASGCGLTNNYTEILVPSALYDTFCKTSGWSDIKAFLVAV